MLHDFWPQAVNYMHIDAWREITNIDGYRIEVISKGSSNENHNLYFINMGGYKPGIMEEYHHKIICVSPSIDQAIKKAKESSFFKEFSLPPLGNSHIDNKYGVDIDEVYAIKDILPSSQKKVYSLRIEPTQRPEEDVLHIGYFKLKDL